MTVLDTTRSRPCRARTVRSCHEASPDRTSPKPTRTKAAPRQADKRTSVPPATSPHAPAAMAVLQQFRELFRVSQQHFQRIESTCGLSGASCGHCLSSRLRPDSRYQGSRGRCQFTCRRRVIFSTSSKRRNSYAVSAIVSTKGSSGSILRRGSAAAAQGTQALGKGDSRCTWQNAGRRIAQPKARSRSSPRARQRAQPRRKDETARRALSAVRQQWQAAYHCVPGYCACTKSTIAQYYIAQTLYRCGSAGLGSASVDISECFGRGPLPARFSRHRRRARLTGAGARI